ncbi:TRAP transporter small permease [Ferrovibrio sp. MS7]|jgi:TRAP-type mannitol/chloroaromatic compound transport system permease small subunit|uniref:TRAP transporter small permease subunit n=1 Tax=Ferrovibrio plantarum TaxID=3119164 RepID=UPI0031365D69
MQFVAAFNYWTDRANNLVYQFCGICMLVIMVIGAVDIVLGNTIGYRPPATIDISQSLFTVSVFLALPIVIARNDHIRVDLFLGIGNGGFRRFSDRISAVISIPVYAVLAYTMWLLFMQSWGMKEKSVSLFAFPIYPIKFAAFIGLTLAAFVSASRLCLMLVQSQEKKI